MHIKMLILGFACLMSTPLLAQERTWSDSSGKFNVTAEIVKFDGQQVTLKKSTGKEIQLSVERLSKKDQKFLAEWQTAKSKPTDDNSADSKANSGAADWLADVKASATAQRSSLSVSGNGKNKKMSRIEISILISGKAAKDAVSFGKLKINSLKDGKGKVLVLPKGIFETNLTKEMKPVRIRGDGFMYDHPKNGLRVELTTIDKSNKVKNISEVKGQIQVLAGGTSKKLTIKDIFSHPNGKIKSTVLEELGIKCDFKRGDNTVELKGVGDISNLSSIQFLDSRGEAIEPNGQSFGGGGVTNWHYSANFNKIPAADWVLEFRVAPENLTIPFEVKNIKIKKQ